jgi:predicted nucleotidyltransferase
MISLKPAELAKVKKILSGNVPEYEVLVYGARAAGAVKNRAYLDLAVMTSDKPLPAARLAKLADAFTAAALPFKVETVDWAGTGNNYRKEIKRTAVVLQPQPKP